jgi:hypothetical protein
MFKRRVDDEVALALLEEQHAPALFALVEANRAQLYDRFVDHMAYGVLASEWVDRATRR